MGYQFHVKTYDSFSEFASPFIWTAESWFMIGSEENDWKYWRIKLLDESTGSLFLVASLASARPEIFFLKKDENGKKKKKIWRVF